MSKDLESINRELQRQVEALTQANHALNHLLKRTRTAVLFLDSRLNIQDFTPALGELFQVTRAVLSRPLRDIIADPDLESAVQKVQAGGTAEEQALHTADGRIYMVRMVADDAAGGSPAGVLLTFTDITRFMQAQEASQQRLALTKAEEKRQAERLSSLGALAAGMAHEINNPLNAILMNAELGLMSLEKKVDPERLVQILHRIVDDAKRGGSITRNVVQFARADNYVPQGLGDLNEIILASRKLVASMLQRYDVKLNFQLEPELPKLKLHQTALEQAVVNLINYAVKSGASQVNIHTARAGDQALFTVSDDGPRIVPGELGHVFDPFYTTRREGGGGAADLGLSLVHRIISDHGGTIDVESPAEGGVQFRIKLCLPADSPHA